MSKRNLPNMKDVADLAQVSVATVDRVMHQRPGVRQRTIDRVMVASEKLGYLFDTANTAPPSSNKPLSIKFLLPDAQNTFSAMLLDGIEYAQERWASHGIQCCAESYPDLNPEALAQAMLRDRQQVDGVVMVAVEHALVREAAQTLADEGVPLVCLVSDLTGAPRTAYVGMDSLVCGRTAAHMIGRFVSGVSAHGHAKVGLISGSLSLRAQVDRQKGFMQVLTRDFSNFQVVGLLEGQEQAQTNHELAKQLLRRHPDIAAIYCMGGGAMGVASAITQANLDHRVLLIGHGLTPGVRRMLLDGTMDASLYQSPQTLIDNAVRVFINQREGNEPTEGIEPIRVQVMLRENLP